MMDKDSPTTSASSSSNSSSPSSGTTPSDDVILTSNSSNSSSSGNRNRGKTHINFAKKLIRFKNTFVSDASEAPYLPNRKKTTIGTSTATTTTTTDDSYDGSPLTSSESVIPLKYSTEEATDILQQWLLNRKANRNFRLFLKTDSYNKQQRLRLAAMKELYDTEVNYLHGLDLCYREYYTPLSKMIEQEELLVIFSNLEQILQLNRELLGDIQKELLAQYHSLGELSGTDQIVEIDNLLWIRCNVGKVFNPIAPFFKIYTTFVNDFDTSNNKIDSLRENNPKINSLLESISDRVGKSLESLLITIIQRIPRYSLLFRELLQRTDPEHVDYHNIESALAKINEQAAFINDTKRQFENDQFYIKLQDKLIHKSNLVQPGRNYIRNCQMRVVCARKSLDHNCTLYLCNDILVVVPEGTEDVVRKLSQIIYFSFSRFKISPSVAYADVLPDESDPSFHLENFQSTSAYHYKFIANSAFEAKEWAILIEESIVEIKRKIEKKTDVNKLEQLVDEQLTKSDFELSKIELKRVNLWNRVNIGEKKIHSIKGDLENKKSAVSIVEYGLRLAQEEKMKLEKLIEKDTTTLEQFKKELGDIEGSLTLLRSKYETEKRALSNIDNYIVKTVLNGDVDGFLEIFDREPTCELNEKEMEALKKRRKYSVAYPIPVLDLNPLVPSLKAPLSARSMNQTSNSGSQSGSITPRDISKIIAERTNKSLLNLEQPFGNGPMRMPALPSQQNPSNASNDASSKNTPPKKTSGIVQEKIAAIEQPLRKHRSFPNLLQQDDKPVSTKKYPAEAPSTISTSGSNTKEPSDTTTTKAPLATRLAQQNTYAKIRRPVRVQIRTNSTILRDDPYFKFVQAKLREVAEVEVVDHKLRDYEKVNCNPLYCLKAVDEWRQIPGSTLVYKYIMDRKTFGEDTTYVTEPLLNVGYDEIIDNRPKKAIDSELLSTGTDLDSFVESDDYDPLLWAHDDLPDDPKLLKDLIIKLQSSTLAWKNRYHSVK